MFISTRGVESSENSQGLFSHHRGHQVVPLVSCALVYARRSPLPPFPVISIKTVIEL